MKDFKRILSLNSANQSDMIAWFCIENSEIGRFKQLLTDGMPLNAFMLTSMVFFGYSNAVIKEVLTIATNHKGEVLDWIRFYFEVDEVIDVLPLYEDLFAYTTYPSDEDCVRMKLWKTLQRRHRADLIAKFAPDTAMEMHLYNELIKTDFSKYAPIFLESNHLADILVGKGGWKYLIDHGKAGWLLEKMRNGYFCGLLPREEVVDYCLQKGLEEEMYQAYYLDALLKHQRFDVFVKNKSFNEKFLTEHPELVQWEDLWQECEGNKALQDFLLNSARKNKKSPNCYEFLLSHSGFIKQLLLFLD